MGDGNAETVGSANMVRRKRVGTVATLHYCLRHVAERTPINDIATSVNSVAASQLGGSAPDIYFAAIDIGMGIRYPQSLAPIQVGLTRTRPHV